MKSNNINLLHRIYANTVENIQTGCLIWTKCKDLKGYGRINYQGTIYRTHRLVYLIHHNLELNTSKYVLHHCDNPSCVYLEHLYLGTQKDNMRDMVKRSRHKPKKGINQPRAKLKNKDIRKIRFLYQNTKTSYKKLALQFNVCKTNIENILRNRTWTHVK